MLERIVDLINRIVVLFGTAMLVVRGIRSFHQLPIDAIPDIPNNQTQARTACPTIATQVVEQFVTAPIENVVRAIPGFVELRSISRFGLSVVMEVFDEQFSIYLARQ